MFPCLAGKERILLFNSVKHCDPALASEVVFLLILEKIGKKCGDLRQQKNATSHFTRLSKAMFECVEPIGLELSAIWQCLVKLHNLEFSFNFKLEFRLETSNKEQSVVTCSRCFKADKRWFGPYDADVNCHNQVLCLICCYPTGSRWARREAERGLKFKRTFVYFCFDPTSTQFSLTLIGCKSRRDSNQNCRLLLICFALQVVPTWFFVSRMF